MRDERYCRERTAGRTLMTFVSLAEIMDYWLILTGNNQAKGSVPGPFFVPAKQKIALSGPLHKLFISHTILNLIESTI